MGIYQFDPDPDPHFQFLCEHGVWWIAELLGVSPGSKLCAKFLNITKHDKTMTKNQFTRTATQPHRNRKLRQLKNDQYCISWWHDTITIWIQARFLYEYNLVRFHNVNRTVCTSLQLDTLIATISSELHWTCLVKWFALILQMMKWFLK